MSASLQNAGLQRVRFSLLAHQHTMLHGKDQLIIGGHNGIRTTGLPNATLLRVEILQHLLVGPVDPRLEVKTGVAGTVATGAEPIVPAGSYCVLTIVRNSTSWVFSSDCLTLRS